MSSSQEPEHHQNRIVKFDPLPSPLHLVRLEITNYSLFPEFLAKLTRNSNLSSSLHELSLVNVGLQEIDGLYCSDDFSSSSSSPPWKQLRVLDIRRNAIKQFPSSFLLVEICPLLFELRVSGQKESCLPASEILRWTQAAIIGHLEMENLHPDKMLVFCEDLACSCLLNISINNQRLQLNPPWCKDPHEFAERKRLIEAAVLESGACPLVAKNKAGHYEEATAAKNSSSALVTNSRHHNLFASFVRTALELIQLNIVVKQENSSSKRVSLSSFASASSDIDEKRDSHSVTKKISGDLCDSSLANAWFDLRFQEQRNWNLMSNDDRGGERSSLSEMLQEPAFLVEESVKLYSWSSASSFKESEYHLLPFIDFVDIPDFVLIKSSGMERRRIIMRSMMKKQQEEKKKMRRSSSTSPPPSRRAEESAQSSAHGSPRDPKASSGTPPAVAPSPSLIRRSSPASASSRRPDSATPTPFSVLHRTMSACGQSVRKGQQFTIVAHHNNNNKNRRPSSVLRLIHETQRYDDDEEQDFDFEEEDVEEEQKNPHHQEQQSPFQGSSSLSPFRNRILIIPTSHTAQINEEELLQAHEQMMLKRHHRSHSATKTNSQDSEGQYRPKRSSSASSSSAALKMANLRSSFKQSEFVRSDTVSVGDPILFLDPAAFGVGAKYVIVSRDLDAKSIICERDPSSCSSSSSFAVDKSLPKRLGVKMEDINRGSASWVTSKSYPPPLQLPIEADFKRGFSHDFIEIRKSFVPLHQYLRDQRHKRTEEETRKVSNLVEDVSNYINLQKYGTTEKPPSAAELYSGIGRQLVSPRTILREKRKREKLEQERLMIEYANTSAALSRDNHNDTSVLSSLFEDSEEAENKKDKLISMVSASRTGSAMKLAQQRAKEFQKVRRTLYDGFSPSAAQHMAIEAERIDPKNSANCSVSLRGLRNSTSYGKHGNQFLPLSVRSYFTEFSNK